MNTRKLASLLAKLEGKKSQARIGDVRELLSLLGVVFLSMEQEEVLATVGEIMKAGSRKVVRNGKRK